MNKRIATLSIVVFVAFCQMAAQTAPSSGAGKKSAASSPATSAEDMNIREYVDLLRADVRHQKAEIMGSMMALDVDQSAKFWPIYADYSAELTKLSDQRLANIKDYASEYDDMTDAKADALVEKSFDYRKQRGELLVKYYGRVKQSLGAIQAARFLQIEEQLLEIIDLQIASSLPIVAKAQ
jgi:hypothetical protein